MATLLDRILGRSPIAAPTTVSPFSERGVGGFVVTRGQLHSGEQKGELQGPRRWTNASDILANVSIVAASVRFYFQLTSRPLWKIEPANDTDEAKRVAEFVESVMHGTRESWSRIVRRSTMYRFHGFGIHEWVAKRRTEDGRIGIDSLNQRPCHTITGWDVDSDFKVRGVIQTPPQFGSDIYLPRSKLVYLVDDTLTDSPEGSGWWRHLVDPNNRLKRYLQLEGIGFERDLSGIPVGKAPIGLLEDMVRRGEMTEARKTELLNGLTQFISMRSKQSDTGIVVESAPYVVTSDQGEQASNVLQWGIDLLTGEQTSMDKMGLAIDRIVWDMALIMGTQALLVGREGAGSLALSKSANQQLYSSVNATLGDMCEAYDRDLIGTICMLNGIRDELKPYCKTEDASFKDVELVTRSLADMAQAGAIMMPDDPAINDVRDMMGVSRQPEIPADLMGLARETAAGGGTPPKPDDPGSPSDQASRDDSRPT